MKVEPVDVDPACLPPPARRGALPELLARLRELGRVAAALDGTAHGSEARQRLLGERVTDPDRDAWSVEATATAELLLHELSGCGVTLHRRATLTTSARAAGLAAFCKHLLPATTPLVIDAAHPLPGARLRGLIVAGSLRAPGTDRVSFRLLPVPAWTPRWVPIDGGMGRAELAPAEELLRLALPEMYDGLVATHVLRVVRPDGQRPALHLEHEPGAPEALLSRCAAACGFAGKPRAVEGLLGLADLQGLCDALGR